VSILILIILMTILYPRCTLTGVFCTHLLHRSHITRLLAIPLFSNSIPRSCLRPLWRRRCLIIPLYTFPRGWMAMATFRMILR
ncbi:hypothetical protein PIB30_106136, partial [Stylosanthes scabra]|nr:hypothetical protein [Stylosanthes scabra]